MSLATRCPACGTVFRVVQDQLRVSEGWVRCGQCQEVFNALESLFELSAEAPLPPPSPPGAGRGAGAAQASGADPVGGAGGPTAAAGVAPSVPAQTPLTDLDLSDPGDGGAVAEAASPPTEAASAISPGSLPGPSSTSSQPEPGLMPIPPVGAAPAPFDPLISVSSLLARPDLVEQAPPPAPAVEPEAATALAPAAAEEAPVPWPTAPMQGDLLPPFDPSAEPADPTPAADVGAGSEAGDPVVPALSDKELAGHELPGSALGDDERADAALRGHDESLAFAPSTSAAPDGADGTGTFPAEPQREWQRKRPRRPRVPGSGADAGDATGAGGHAAHLEPAFLRRAARDARWQLPAVRASLCVAAALLGLLLLAQAALLFRDGLAARWPALQPSLAQACDTLGCSLAAPRALDRISLDGSKLTSVQVEAGSSAQPADRPLGKVLRFAAELHNAAPHRVQAPALELSFTDPLGQVVARRVLLPDELGLGAGTIAAGGTWQVDTRLAVGELQVAGFSAEIFYP